MTRKKRLDVVSRRDALKAGAIAVSGLAPSTTAAAKPGRGPPGTRGCDVVVPDDEPTVTDGVNAADPGDRVCVKAEGGPYTEQVVVDKDLTLSGVNSPTITAPSSPTQFTISESGWTWEPIVFAFGGSESGGDVTGSGTVDVSVSGFTIDGGDREPSGLGVRSVGVFLRNVSGAVEENVVERMNVDDTGPASHSLGIASYGNSDVTIADNEVKDYGRLGIFVTGDAGTGVPDPDGSIHDNTVTGHDDDSAATPLGIQLSFGATGTIRGNTVEGNAASEGEGVVVVDSEGVPITDNTIEGNETSVVIGSVNVFGLTPHLKAENNKVTSNDIAGISGGDHVGEGVFLWSAEDNGSVDNTKVVNNAISEHEDGVVIDASGDGATADNVKIIHNTFDAIDDDDIDSSDGTNTKQHANA